MSLKLRNISIVLLTTIYFIAAFASVNNSIVFICNISVESKFSTTKTDKPISKPKPTWTQKRHIPSFGKINFSVYECTIRENITQTNTYHIQYFEQKSELIHLILTAQIQDRAPPII
ncbi:MAG: hypothetical protein N3A61_06985 [Ignavibacteria bacterium]|nr:hypothetical protein [Ignavibacteria bacterium]